MTKNSRRTEVTEMIDADKLSTIDWSKAAFPIGVEIPGQENPWLGLDEEDLRILSALLLKQLIRRRPDGVEFTDAIADSSPKLKMLGEWAQAAAMWLRDRNRLG